MSGKTPDWMPELFFCHRYEFAVVADQLGFRIGTRADQFQTNRTQQLLDEGFEVDFVDNDFENPDREQLETIIDKTNPTYAVLPDIYDESDVESVITFGRELEDTYGTTPIVVPKDEFDHNRIPDDWILGFSVPSGYGETDIPIENFQSHRIHLLGGSPRSQIMYANNAISAGLEIFSLDGNAFSKASEFGNIINEPVEMLDENGELDERAWVKDADGYTEWGQRIVASLARYYELWRQWSMIQNEDLSAEDVEKNR